MMGYTTMQHQRTDNHEYYQVALVEKDLPANAGDTRDVSLIPGWSRKWQPLQYSCLENSTNRRAWQATVHGAAKSWIRLND